MARRELDKKYRVQARTTDAIQAGWDACLAELAAGRDITFRGRKLSNDALLNGLVLWFLDLGGEERRDRAAAMVARLEEHLEGRDPERPSPGRRGRKG